MDNKTAYEKFKKAKANSIENSPQIEVGRLAFIEAMNAMQKVERLSETFEKIKEYKERSENYITEEMIGAAFAYDRVLKLLEPLVENEVKL